MAPETDRREDRRAPRDRRGLSVDEAAKAAIDLGVPTYQFLRKYIERRLPVPLSLKQVDPIIRQALTRNPLGERRR